jgi:putative ABC transport system substrate-binding protein
LAASKVTRTIPIVFLSGSDQVTRTLMASYSRPQANATGINILVSDLAPKRLELLREMRPAARTVAFLVNPVSPIAEAQERAVQTAARTVGFDLQVLKATTVDDIAEVFSRLAERRPDTLLFSPDPLFFSHRALVIALAARHGIATIYDRAEYTNDGGLISFGPDFRDAFRLLGVYAGKILSGVRPADLPVQQPTGFTLVVNLGTAKAMGLAVPPAILARADEVIE